MKGFPGAIDIGFVEESNDWSLAIARNGVVSAGTSWRRDTS